MSKLIPLTQGKFAVVDDCDYSWLNNWKWCFDKKYATRQESRTLNNGKQKVILMHRFILNVPGDLETDHKNGNGLDNQRCNLRICTTQQNHFNCPAHKNNTSGFKGVCLHKGSSWIAQIQYNQKNIYLGTFKNKIEAAKAYDEKAKELFGEFAQTNF